MPSLALLKLKRKKMKTKLATLMLSLAIFGSAHADVKTLEQNLKTNYPDLPVKVFINRLCKAFMKSIQAAVLFILIKMRSTFCW